MVTTHPRQMKTKGDAGPWWRRSWLTSALRAVDKELFRETVAVALTVTTIALGIVLTTASDRWADRATFFHIIEVAPVTTWGVAFIACGIALLATVLSSRKDAYWPAFFLTGLYCLWSNRLAASALSPESVPSALVMFSFASLLALLVALSYWRESRIES